MTRSHGALERSPNSLRYADMTRFTSPVPSRSRPKRPSSAGTASSEPPPPRAVARSHQRDRATPAPAARLLLAQGSNALRSGCHRRTTRRRRRRLVGPGRGGLTLRLAGAHPQSPPTPRPTPAGLTQFIGRGGQFDQASAASRVRHSPSCRTAADLASSGAARPSAIRRAFS